MSRFIHNLPVLAAIAATCAWAADARRGAMLLDDAGCLECHTVHGEGVGHEPNATAPELGSNLLATYTAPALAAAIWNLTPAMLADMLARGVNLPALKAKDWEDVFAYLYSAQFLDFPAETGRGRQAFQAKQCDTCHSLDGHSNSLGRPVSGWARVEDPVTLASRMWNHAAPMDQAGREADWTGPGWTKISGRDLMDLTVYVQQLQGSFRNAKVALPDAASGQPLFDQKCGRCHAGPLALETSLRNTTWTDIAASMWNHVTQMRHVSAISEPDMRKILAYVWELQYRGPTGDPKSGEQIFARDGCTSCHDVRGTVHVTPAFLAATGWGPGREMHQEMIKKGVAWPHLSAQDMADLAAFLNTPADREATNTQSLP